MLAKNVTEIKLFIKELDGKNRSDRNTYILVRNCREGSMFCDVHFTKQHKTKSTYFYITVKVRLESEVAKKAGISFYTINHSCRDIEVEDQTIIGLYKMINVDMSNDNIEYKKKLMSAKNLYISFLEADIFDF